MTLYRDPSRPVEARVDDLLSVVTLDEKIAQLHALRLFLSEDGAHEVRTDQFAGSAGAGAAERLLEHGLGQITRPLGTASVEPRAVVRALNRLQKRLVEQTRLGIPVISHEECLSGLMARDATLFPSSLAYGATWNPELIERVGAAIGAESLSVGARQGLAPVLYVARDARWGRTEETFAEDPYLPACWRRATCAGCGARTGACSRRSSTTSVTRSSASACSTATTASRPTGPRRSRRPSTRGCRCT